MSISPKHGTAIGPSPISIPGNSPGVAGLLLGSGGVLAFLICYLAFDSNSAVAWSVVTITTAGAVAWQRFRANGLLDALGLFSFGFLAYNGILLLRLATMADPTATIYPWPFTQETYGRAGGLNAVAGITILLTATLATRIFGANKRNIRTDATTDGANSGWFYAGLAMYVVGLAMYFLQYQQYGGYFAVMQKGRLLSCDQGDANKLSWPYLMFIVPGIAGMWYAVAGQRKAAWGKWVAWASLVLWCGLELLQGYRLLIVQAVFAVLAVWFTRKRRPFKIDLRVSVLLLVVYGAFASFAYLRNYIPPLFGGEMTAAEAGAAVQSTSWLDAIKPERTELAGPYLSLLQASSGAASILTDISYFEAIPAVLPRALYPGTKPAYFSERFAVSLARGSGPVAGWGFNPVAEAYMNFGIGGIIVIFMLWTLAFFWLDKLKYQAPLGTLLFAVLLAEAIDANRIDFRNIYAIALYFSAGVMLMLFLSKLFTRIARADS